jgi:phosphatidylserine/phosphatidylglycerophosphate/cardiolipin synthase-like enzyme
MAADTFTRSNAAAVSPPVNVATPPPVASVGGTSVAAAPPPATVPLAQTPLFQNLQQVAASVPPFTSEDLRTYDARVKMLDTAHESLLARRLLIQEAKYNLALTVFRLDDDETGQILLEDLKAALRRGVSVTLMVDGFGGGGRKGIRSESLQRRLEDLKSTEAGYRLDANGRPTTERARVDVAVIRPVWPVKRQLLNFGKVILEKISKRSPRPEGIFDPRRRAHDKIELKDWDHPELAAAILGGRNDANAYFRLGTPRPDQYQDMDVLIRPAPGATREGGSLGEVIHRYNERLFFHRATEELLTPARPRASPPLHATTQLTRQILDRDLEAWKQAGGPERGLRHTGFMMVNEIENLTRPLRRFKDRFDDLGNKASIVQKFSEQIPLTQRTIDLASPYMVFSEIQMDQLASWLAGDPTRRVRFVTNSFYNSSHFFQWTCMVDHNLVRLHEKIMARGANPQQFEVYELGRLNAPTAEMLHAKYILFDKDRALVTSSNLDPISRLTNSESGAFLTAKPDGQPTIVEDIQQNFEQLIQQSVRRGSPEWKALHERPGLRIYDQVSRFIQPFLALPGVMEIL